MNARRLLESVIELEQDGNQHNKLLENGSAGIGPGAESYMAKQING
tara:strand:- start:205 stop:342 length:138 start_codon:yes stop_codon:yes gene_type:complete